MVEKCTVLNEYPLDERGSIHVKDFMTSPRGHFGSSCDVDNGALGFEWPCVNPVRNLLKTH